MMVNFKIQAIAPKRLPKGSDYSREIEKRVLKTAALVLRDLESTTRTWEHKPTFDITITRKGGDFNVSVGTDDKVYGFVDAGTKPHVIEPKRSRYLSFSSGYRAKTRVGIIGSRAGGATGSPVFAKRVKHPGFPGRQFSAKIMKRRQVTMTQEISDGIADVNKTAE